MEYTSLGVEHGGGGGAKSGPLTGGWEMRTLPRGQDLDLDQDQEQERLQGTKGDDHRRPRRSRWSGLNAYELAADFFCVALPLGLLGFLIAVVRLDGREAESGPLNRWQNAISIVSLT